MPRSRSVVGLRGRNGGRPRRVGTIPVVSEATKINRRELGADWLDSRDAARMVGCTLDHFNKDVGAMITRQSRSLRGKTARAVGYAYLRADCERLKAIRKALGVTAIRAAQLISGIRRLGHLGLLEDIERQPDLTPQPRKPRRKQ